MQLCLQSSPSVKLAINVTVMNYVKALAHHKNKCSARYLKKSLYFGKPVKKSKLNYTSDKFKDD